MTQSTTNNRIDWQTERDRIDFASVVADLLGPPSSRQGSRLLWHCPFHDDHNPSFTVDPIKRRWNCYPCGIGGDAVELVMRHNQVSFPEAIGYLTGHPSPSKIPKPRPQPKPPPLPSGLPEAEARALVIEAEARLWTLDGSEALAYLTDYRRLDPDTVRAARLGWTPGVRLETKDGRPWTAQGVVVPWFEGERLALLKIRQPEGSRPKYAEAFRDRPSLFPDPGNVRPGRPLVIVEGEFDALLLGQELGDLASVVTLGGTGSTKPETHNLGRMLAAPRWYIATDADPAGDKAAEGWPARARRVRPPGQYKDWTEARQAGVDLRRWWADRLEGIESPPLFTWPELAAWRWGPAVNELYELTNCTN
jgi:DNA primase